MTEIYEVKMWRSAHKTLSLIERDVENGNPYAARCTAWCLPIGSPACVNVWNTICLWCNGCATQENVLAAIREADRWLYQYAYNFEPRAYKGGVA